MRWSGFQLTNIQTWEDNFVELNAEGLTVIKALSETGKSVFIKCLRLALNYDRYTHNNRKVIVRNWWEPNPKPGHFTIFLDRTSFVQFTYTTTNVSTKVVYPDGTKRAWKGTADEEVIKMLGLIVCKGSDKILNILDNETPMLYDSTDQGYNNSIMDVYVNHHDLKARKENCESHIQTLKSSIRNRTMLRRNKQEDLNRVPYVGDLTRAKQSIDIIDNLINTIDVCSNVIKELDNMSILQQAKCVNISPLEDKFNYMNLLREVVTELEIFMENKNYRTIKLSELELAFRRMEKFTKLINELETIEDFESVKPLDSLDKIESSYKILCRNTELVNMIELLYLEFNGDKRVLDSEQLEGMDKNISGLEKTMKMIYCLEDIEQAVDNLNLCEEESDELNKLWELYKEQYKVCPLCEQALDKVRWT